METLDELKDIKKAIGELLEDVADANARHQRLLAPFGDLRFETAEDLQRTRDEQKIKLDKLLKRADDLEQFFIMNEVVITGLQAEPRDGARAATAAGAESSSLKQQVKDFLMSRGIFLDVNQLEACRLLPGTEESDEPSILLRFENLKHKKALMKQRRKLRGSGVLMDDHLTENWARRRNNNPQM